MVKYFSLNRPPIKFEEGKLQENLKLLHRKMREKFTLLYQDRSEKKSKVIKMPVVLFWDKKLKYYILKYDRLYTDDELMPLVITFNDRDTYKNNNNAYISNIHKTEKISGSEMVTMAIKLIFILGAEKIMIDDGATIDCQGKEISLSPFKLLEKNRTFYMKFGFRPYDDSANENPRYIMRTKNAMKNKDRSIKKIKSMRIESIRRYLTRLFNIYTSLMKSGKYDSIRFHYPYTIPTKEELRHIRRTKPQKDNKQAVADQMAHITRLFEILPKRGRLWPWLKNAFYKKCDQYNDFMENMMDKLFTGIEWKRRFIWNRYAPPFWALNQYSHLALKLERK